MTTFCFPNFLEFLELTKRSLIVVQSCSPFIKSCQLSSPCKRSHPENHPRTTVGDGHHGNQWSELLPPTFCCGEPVLQTLAVGAEWWSTSARVTHLPTRAAALEEDSLLLRAVGEFTVTRFLPGPILSLSSSSLTLSLLTLSQILLDVFYLFANLLCSSPPLFITFCVIFVLLASHFTPLFDCRQSPRSRWLASRHTLAARPRPPRSSRQPRRWRISLWQDYRVLCHMSVATICISLQSWDENVRLVERCKRGFLSH